MRHLSRAHFGLLLGFGCCSCYAGIGPSIGMAGGSPTLGWEVSAATVSVGQSFATKSESALAATAKSDDYNFKRRTYLLWEPQLGKVFGDTEETFAFTGLGGSIGMRWDTVAGGAGRREFGPLGGLFVGAGVAGGAPPAANGHCKNHASPYGSLVIGFRGSEFYLMPKVGVALVSELCSSDDND
jgi:hypothetical protein